MLGPFIFAPLLALVCAFALWRGGRDERVVAMVCIIGTLATMALISPISERYSRPELAIMLVDLGVFAGFTAVALTSSRFWPLWVSGLQLTTGLGHVLKFIDSDLLPRAYGAALQFWSYPILIILFAGTWRTARRWRLEQASQPT